MQRERERERERERKSGQERLERDTVEVISILLSSNRHGVYEKGKKRE